MVKKKVGRPKGVRKRNFSPETKAVRRVILLTPTSESLLIQESIIRGMSVSGIVSELIHNHQSHNSMQMRYLKAILVAVTGKRGMKQVTDGIIALNDYDKMLISQLEIEAASFKRNKNKVKQQQVELPKEKINIFDIETIKNQP